MNKPIPRAEIIIKSFPVTETLIIYVATPDMREWIRQQASEYGHLIEDRDAFILCVNPCYDTDEIADYLRGKPS